MASLTIGTGGSPIKPSANPATRAARTLHLRNNNFVVELKLDEFEKAFFDVAVTTQLVDACLPQSNYNEYVKKIRGAKEAQGYEPVCGLLNETSGKYYVQKKVPQDDQVAFIAHQSHAPRHHPDVFLDRKATQNPDIVALRKVLADIWESDVADWRVDGLDDDKYPKPAVAWHVILSILEGKGPKFKDDPVCQAATYAGSLLQARPDVPGNFSIAYTTKYFCILWCDPAGVYTTEQISWKSPNARRFLVHYVHRLHTPLLSDPTIRLQPPPASLDHLPAEKWQKKTYALPPVWLVRDPKEQMEYRVSKVVSVGQPWTRMNVVYESNEYGKIGQPLCEEPTRIIKDSFPDVLRLERASEGRILDEIHRNKEHILGVMAKIHAFEVRDDEDPIETIYVDVLRDGKKIPRRAKYRIILEGYANKSVFTCTSVLEVLCVTYDVLELDEFIHKGRGVLHRDISPRNLLRAVRAEFVDWKARSSWTFSAKQPVFIQSLLGYQNTDSQDTNVPSCILIDFDNAKLDGLAVGVSRTATSSFVARALSTGFTDIESLPLLPVPALKGKAEACYVAAFTRERYDARSALHSGKTTPILDKQLPVLPAPRHDAESCYWLIVYLLILALPRDAPREEDDTTAMSRTFHLFDTHRTGPPEDSRDVIIKWRKTELAWQSLLHPGLHCLAQFLADLTKYQVADYALVEQALDPYHLHEVMKRLILQEVWRLTDAGDPLYLHEQQRALREVSTEGHSSTQPSAHAKRAADGIIDESDRQHSKHKKSRQSINHTSAGNSSTVAGSSSRTLRSSLSRNVKDKQQHMDS